MTDLLHTKANYDGDTIELWEAISFAKSNEGESLPSRLRGTDEGMFQAERGVAQMYAFYAEQYGFEPATFKAGLIEQGYRFE